MADEQSDDGTGGDQTPGDVIAEIDAAFGWSEDRAQEASAEKTDVTEAIAEAQGDDSPDEVRADPPKGDDTDEAGETESDTEAAAGDEPAAADDKKTEEETLFELRQKLTEATGIAKERERRAKRDQERAREQVASAQKEAEYFRELRQLATDGSLPELVRRLGLDERAVYEAWTTHRLRADPNAEATDSVRRELAEIRQQLEAERQQRQQAEQQAFVERRLGEIADLAGDAEQFPLVSSRLDRRKVAQEVANRLVMARQQNIQLDDSSALRQIEDELSDLLGPTATAETRAPAQAGSGHGTPRQPPKPNSAVATAPKPQSVTSELATAAGSQRPLTERELREAAIKSLDW